MSSYGERDIMHERGRFFVIRVPRTTGRFEVLRNEATGAVHRATFHYSTDPQRALAEAIDNCNRRASGNHWAGAKA
jgi:hypothetical protein